MSKVTLKHIWLLTLTRGTNLTEIREYILALHLISVKSVNEDLMSKATLKHIWSLTLMRGTNLTDIREYITSLTPYQCEIW